MSNLGFDQNWAQDARHNQPQGIDIVEIVRHVVSGVLAANGAQNWSRHQNQNNASVNPWGYAGNFGQQTQGFSNQQQHGFGQQWSRQQGIDIEQLIRAIVPAILNARAGQQSFNDASFNPYNNFAQQNYGQFGQGQFGQGQFGQGQWGQDQLRQQFNRNGFNQPFGAQSSNNQGYNNWQQQDNELNNLLHAIVPAVLNAVSQQNNNQFWNNNNAQQGNYQQTGLDQSNLGNNNAFGGQNAYDQQQQQLLRGVDLSLLIRAIAPDIAKAVVPVVLANLAGQQQGQNRQVG